MTIHVVITIALSKGWKLHQLDINNAFLKGNLNDKVYMSQLPSFEDVIFYGYACKLQNVIYDLKQALRA